MYMEEAKKAKIAAQQRALNDVEVADCTFKPQLVAKNKFHDPSLRIHGESAFGQYLTSGQ